MSTLPLHNRGFTLIETLVAITILLLVVVGPITVAQRGIKSAYYANEQVTAVFLAQEAIEAIRELRDTDALTVYNGDGTETWIWKNSLPASCEGVGGCGFDLLEGTFETCGAPENNTDCELKVDPATGKYSYATGINSGFKRRVYLTPVGSEAVSVRVEVTWDSVTFNSGAPRTVALETWIYNHYRRYSEF
jgi:prepilin-type N-terminal cleavage/methylation domain-containing protein